MPNPRGLLQWLQSLKAVQKTPTAVLRDGAIAVDASKYFSQTLVRDAWAEALGVVQIAHIQETVEKHVKAFEELNTSVIWCFEGISTMRRLSADPSTYAPTDSNAGERDRAWTEYREGRTETATKYFNELQTTPDFLNRPALEVVKETLLRLGAKVIVAPYDVEPQMAWFAHPPHQFVHAVYGDPDLLLFAVDKVITKLDIVNMEKCEWVSLASVLDSTELTFRQLTEACMIAGYRGSETLASCLNKVGFIDFQLAVDQVLQEYQERESLTEAQKADPAFAPLLRIIDRQEKWDSPVQKVNLVKAINSNLRYLERQLVFVGGKGEMGPLRYEFTPLLPIPKVPTAASKSSKAKKLLAKAAAKGAILQDFDENALNGSNEQAGETKTDETSATSNAIATATLPSAVATAVASGTLAPSTLEPLFTGLLVDRPQQVLSSAHPRLLDALAPLRAQAMLLLASAFGDLNDSAAGTASLSPILKELSKTTSALGAPIHIPDPSSEKSLSVMNVRFYDRTEGYWPRELCLDQCQSEDELAAARNLVPDVFSHLSANALTSTSATEAHEFIGKFYDAALKLCEPCGDVFGKLSGSALLVQVLRCLAILQGGKPGRCGCSNKTKTTGDCAALVTVALATLYALKLITLPVDAKVELTQQGQAVANAADAAANATEEKEHVGVSEEVANALLLASVLCQTEVLSDQPITLLLPLSASISGSGFFKPYNHSVSATTPQERSRLYLSRVAGLLPSRVYERTTQRGAASIIQLDSKAASCQDISAVSNAATSLQRALRQFAEAAFVALLASQRVMIAEVSDFHDPDTIIEDEQDPEMATETKADLDEPALISEDDVGSNVNVRRIARRLPFSASTRPDPLAGIHQRDACGASESLSRHVAQLGASVATLLKGYRAAGVSVEVESSTQF